MKVYLANGIYIEKQEDARKAARLHNTKFETVDFPFAASPKSDFVDWLNNGKWPRASVEVNAQDRDDTFVDDLIARAPKTPPIPKPDERFIEQVRVDISIEEQIQTCDLPRLATLASNVAWRFNELAKTK